MIRMLLQHPFSIAKEQYIVVLFCKGDLSFYGDYKLFARHRDRAFYAAISDLILDGC
jgi:hypothetical protein